MVATRISSKFVIFSVFRYLACKAVTIQPDQSRVVFARQEE
jgi:hypothetical protein